MKLGLGLKTGLSQTLTPQQIQYLKLLQMPMVQLEQQVRQEIELNPMLEEFSDDEFDDDFNELDDYDEYDDYGSDDEPIYADNFADDIAKVADTNDYQAQDLYIEDKAEPFEFQKMILDSDSDSQIASHRDDDDDFEPFQIKDNGSFIEEITTQLNLLPLTDEEKILGEFIVGNLDADGYLRRELVEILEEANEEIIDRNLRNLNTGTAKGLAGAFQNNSDTYKNGLAHSQKSPFNSKPYLSNGIGTYGAGTMPQTNQEDRKLYGHRNSSNLSNSVKTSNPAQYYKLSGESAKILNKVYRDLPELQFSDNPKLETFVKDHSEITANRQLRLVTMEDAENVLNFIRHLDPPGIGSRTIQECLMSQLEVMQNKSHYHRLAYMVLSTTYEAFAKKHYHVITKQLDITDEMLRSALDVIRTLNPRPGGGHFIAENNSVIPDFVVERDDETNDFLIAVNDSRMPVLQLSKAYDNIKKEAKYKLYNKDTREWIRNKREDAKFLIQALKQRKSTMLKVMTAIAGLQRDFFDFGPSALKPLIYKDVAEDTGLDISTICRIVNGKFVQTGFGTFELKFFFSESLPSDEGEEVSTRVIKQILKEVIDAEQKGKPHSDDKLAKILKQRGYNVARRTVAKYREQLNIPVARLRKEL